MENADEHAIRKEGEESGLLSLASAQAAASAPEN
jgi:hypothetical protein